VPLPPHFQAERVGEVWRVPYEERAREAGEWARRHGIEPAAHDGFRICLVAVDVQNTFCTPGFELFVPGAVEDSRRLCEFVYRNLGAITEVVPTLDTHQAIQIFHAAFLVDGEGNRPDPYTLVSAGDAESGRWRIDPELGVDPDYLLRYTRALDEGGRYRLTVWPYHAMLGGIGHALVSSVEEAFFFHAIARRAAPAFEIKGFNPLTEHYSVLGPEVLGEKNEALIRRLLSFDAVVFAGQAKSHCVAWTIDDLLRHPDAEEQELARRMYLLEDCTSPVVVPGVVDYTEEADAAVRRFAEAGMHVVRSTDPLESWPGLIVGPGGERTTSPGGSQSPG
jgi:nicotinamidase-related amidase